MTLLLSILPEFSKEALFFSAVSALGLFFLLIGWLLSNIGDFDFFGGDIEDLGDIDIEGLNTDAGEFINTDLALPIPSFFSLKVLRIVMLCFGVGGNTGLSIGLSFIDSLIMATIVGFVSGFIVYKAFVYIYKQTIYNFRDPVLIGREGKVILSIPSNGFGQIAIFIVGQRYIFRAISTNNESIEEGKPIKIKGKTKGTCIVESI